MAFFVNSDESNLASEKSNTKFLLISELEQSGDLIKHLTQFPQIILGVTESFQSFFSNSKLCYTNWSGILVNHSTYKHFNARDKDLFHAIVQGYPVHFLRKNESGEIDCIDPADLKPTDLQNFLNSCINSEQARPLRRQQRYELNTEVSIQCLAPARWTDTTIPETVQNQEKTSTLNVSEGGAYILTANHYNIGDIVKVTLPILGEDSDVRSEVRWIKSSETELTEQAGIGVLFLDISNHQKQSLQTLLRI